MDMSVSVSVYGTVRPVDIKHKTELHKCIHSKKYQQLQSLDHVKSLADIMLALFM